MKIGDLVELSAHGRRLQRNAHFNDRKELVGIIINFSMPFYTVQWFDVKRTFWYAREEMKHVK